MDKKIWWGTASCGLDPAQILSLERESRLPSWFKKLWEAAVGGDVVELAKASENAAAQRRSSRRAAIVAILAAMLFTMPLHGLACVRSATSFGCEMWHEGFLPSTTIGPVISFLAGLLFAAVAIFNVHQASQQPVLTRMFLYGKGLIACRIAQEIGPNPTDLNAAAKARLIVVARRMVDATTAMNGAIHDYTRRMAEEDHARHWRRFNQLREIFAAGHLVSPVVTPDELLGGENGGNVATMRTNT